MISDLERRLEKVVRRKIIKVKNKEKATHVIHANLTSIGWNFVIIIFIFLFLGIFIGNYEMFNSENSVPIFIFIGVFIASINTYLSIKKIYKGKRK